MEEKFSRSELLLGKDGLSKLKNAHIAVFGIGGVGGHAVEALVRCGVGNIDVIDCDVVSVSNLNRQIIALESTVGRAKTDVMLERIKDINPECNAVGINKFYAPENAENFDLSRYDYIIDAIDTVTSKLELITRAESLGVSIISSMGTGNKLDPTRLRVADIYKTSFCPLARVMRSELRKRGVRKLKVVFSDEEPIRAVAESNDGRHSPGSVSFVPSVAGLIIAGEVIKEICSKDNLKKSVDKAKL